MGNIWSKYAYYIRSIARLLTGFNEWPLVLRIYLGLQPVEPVAIRLRQSGAQFFVRGAMDIWSIKETYLDRLYEINGTPIGNGWTIVDIGAGVGDFTLLASQTSPDNRVFAYEPFPESYALLEKNTAINQAKNVHHLPAAVWSGSGELVMDDYGEDPLQFTSRSVGDSLIQESRQIVPAVSLADVFIRHNISRCDLLKLDCEGAEYEILLSATMETLLKVRRLVMETHDQPPHHHHQEIVRYLEDSGFVVQTSQNLVHPHLGYLFGERVDDPDSPGGVV
jgi:FkbM family methyltransferase